MTYDDPYDLTDPKHDDYLTNLEDAAEMRKDAWTT